VAKRNCFLKEKFWRLTSKKQRKQPTVVAVAHTLLLLVYQVLKTREPYQERGQPLLDEQQKNRIIKHHVRRLGKLGGKSALRAAGPGRAGRAAPRKRSETQDPAIVYFREKVSRAGRDQVLLRWAMDQKPVPKAE
jgi:hypothetical protein